MIFRFNPSLAVFCWRYCGAEGPTQSDHLPAACAGDKTWKSHLIYCQSTVIGGGGGGGGTLDSIVRVTIVLSQCHTLISTINIVSLS